jgi:two-component system sensor histidine kinase PilS (NtrC family)
MTVSAILNAAARPNTISGLNSNPNPNSSSNSNIELHQWSFWVPAVLVVVYAIVLMAALVGAFFQKDFFNPIVLLPLYSVVAGIEFLLVVFLWKWQEWKANKNVFCFLFIANFFFITALISLTGWMHSVFFLVYLINIIGAGILLQSEGSFWVAALSSVGFNISVLLGPDVKSMNFLFFLALNNVSFFVVSGIAGSLSDELLALGLKLSRASTDLKKLRNINELVLENMPSAVVALDHKGVLIPFNSKFSEIIGAEQLDEIFKNNGSFIEEKEIRFQDKLKGARYLRVKEGKLNEDDILSRVYIIDDVTEIRNYEWQMREQEKLAAVGKLATGIAHEIRNPLASISGSVQLLSQQASQPDDQKLFSIVIKETDRLNDLISEFLDYAKPLPKPTDIVVIKTVLSEVLELNKYNQRLNQNVQVNLDLVADGAIYGFRDKLKQAFMNIIINAYQAMDKSTTQILNIKLVEKDLSIVLSIKDSGSGMSPEVQKRLFEPFFTTKSRGTGLGLAVTHRILEAHGASILVESEKEKGTEFVIQFSKSVKV